MTNNRYKNNIRKIMRVSFLLVLVQCSMAILLIAREGNSQTIDLNYEYTSILTVLTAIEKQSEVSFVYDEQVLRRMPGVSIRASKRTLEEVLAELEQKVPIRFKQVQNLIGVTVMKVEPVEVAPVIVRQVAGAITGKVTDARTGDLLPAASVFLEETGRGTSANAEGEYRLSDVPPGNYTIVASFVGYQRQEKQVAVYDDEIATVNFELEGIVGELDEVMVNAGYYNVSNRLRTGSISRITAEDIADQPFTNPLEALVGRVPGVTVSASGTPGRFLQVRVRGENSLRSIFGGFDIPGAPTGIYADGGAPLYIIDGVPINSNLINSQINSRGLDPLANLNPENIASIEVLKDADATAIYGSRGANGVILITTKEGSAQKTDVQFSINRGVGKSAAHIDLLNTEEYLQMRREALENDGIDLETQSDLNKATLYPDLVFWDQDRSTDWQKELLDGTSQFTDIQANISGGSGNTTYRLGGSFRREDLINRGDSWFGRAEGHLSINHRSEDNRFNTGVNLNYGINQQDLQGGSLMNALWLPPNAPPLYDENGELNWAIDPETGRSTWTNPLAALTAKRTLDNRNLVANANLGYRPIPELEFRLNLGYTENKGKENSQTPLTSVSPEQRYNPATGGGIRPSSRFGNTERQGITLEPQVDYRFESGQHQVDVLIGGAYQQSENEVLFINGSEYTSDAFLGSLTGAGLVSTNVDTRSEYVYLAAFGRVGYRYKERYILNLTGRRDGSSRFGPGKRFGNFGALGAAWIFSDEPWLQEGSSILSFGKLRGSYGITGNDNVGDYLFFDLYQLFDTNYENAISLTPRQLFNPGFNWEETRKLEAALELGFLDNRIMLETSWYRNRSSNQLIFRVVPHTSGFPGVVDNFSEAVVENSGWELLLRGEPVRQRNFGWTISANLSINRNKLVAFPGIKDSPYATVYQVGSPLSIQRLYTWLGVDPETGVHQFLDVDENGIINDDDKQFSNALEPDFMGGLSQQFRYKGLELDMLFQFSRQNGRYFPQHMPGGRNNQPKIVLDRWQEQGDITDIQRYSAQALGGAYFQLGHSDADIEDQSFIRLRTLGLSYRFQQSLVEQVGVRQMRLFVRAQNLLVFSRASTPDPETGYGVPLQRMINGGLHINF